MSDPTPRERMIVTAMELFQREGFRATSWRKLVQESGAPWGSAHHYFPGGKTQLGVAAVEMAAGAVKAMIERAFAPDRPAPEGVRRLFEAAARGLEQSGFRSGCPVTTVALETTPDSAPMAEACKAAFALWRAALRTGLERGGVGGARAAALATAILAMFEGGLVLARAEQSTEPMREAAEAAAVLAGGGA